MNWSDLSAAEVLEQLHALRAAGRPPVSGFLDTHQYSELLELGDIQSGGGYPVAQRRRVGLSSAPDLQFWKLSAGNMPELASARALRQRLHRDLSPDSLGDIHWGDTVAIVSLPEVRLDELLAGALATDSWDPPEPRPERVTSASERLDSAVSSLFKVSRGEAQTAIEYNFVFLNFRPASKRTQAVKRNDQLVYRTKGRVELVDIELNPRSGRSILHFHRFPV